MSEFLTYKNEWWFGVIPLITIPYLILALGEGGEMDDWLPIFGKDKNLFGEDDKRTNPITVTVVHLVVTLVLFVLILSGLGAYKGTKLTLGNLLGSSGMFMNLGVVLGFLLHIVAIVFLFVVKE